MKITMVEYQGRVDENGQAVGHGPKVLNDYIALLKNVLDIEVFAPKAVLKAAGSSMKGRAKVLKKQIVMRGGKSVFTRISEKFGMFKNIRDSLRHAEGDILWFFNVEFYLMLYLAMHRRPKQRIVCTLFLDGYHGGIIARIKQKIFEKAQKKIDYIIATGPQLTFKNTEYTFLPDYGCDEEKYSPYRRKIKNGQAIILGTMGPEKELEQAVETFHKLDMPLTIAGRFHDKERLARLKELAGEKITFVDSYLTEQQYLSMLADSSYVLLPYAPKKYATQTSGVLQEAVFVGTIPLGYEEVLSGNGVAGVGFQSWADVTDCLLSQNHDVIYEKLADLRNTVYNQEKLGKELYHIFEKLQ